MVMNEILEGLSSPIFVNEDEVAEHIAYKVQEIKENGQEHGRDDETLTKHVRNGTILEYALANKLGGFINPSKFDHTDPNTFAWDVDVNGVRFEIKSSPSFDTWFNFNLKNQQNFSDYQLVRADLSTFLKYTDYVDYLVAGFYSEVENGYEVTFKWIMNAKNFQDYVRNSRPQKSGTTNYYDTRKALMTGDCYRLSEF
jgi:hypothetical protein